MDCLIEGLGVIDIKPDDRVISIAPFRDWGFMVITERGYMFFIQMKV